MGVGELLKTSKVKRHERYTCCLKMDLPLQSNSNRVKNFIA